MCVIEQKTYIHADGQQQTSESTRPCRNALAGRPCTKIERRTTRTTRIIGTRPLAGSSSSNSSNGLLATPGRDERARRYRDLSRRSSLRETVGRNQKTSSRISPEPPGVPMSPPTIRPSSRPELPTSSIRRAATPHPSILPPRPNVAITPEGTAVYDRPPSLEMPRALDNQRKSRRVSFNDPATEAGKYRTEERTPDRQQRPSLFVNTSGTASPPRSSPGLSRLPSIRTIRQDRHDSARDLPFASNGETSSSQASRSTSASYRARPDSEAARLCASIAEQDRKQADVERQRYQAREQARESTRRERNRKEAAEALEGRARVERERDTEFELAQLSRERDAAVARRISRDRQQQYAASEPLTLSFDERRQSRPRRSLHAGSNSPLSPRRRLAELPRPRQTTVLHQPILPPVASAGPSSIRERGRGVIEREQARAAAAEAYYADRTTLASERLQDAVGGLRLEERRPDDYFLYQPEYVSEGAARREERRRRKDDRTGGFVYR